MLFLQGASVMANTWDQMTFDPLTKFYFYCNVDGQRSEWVFDKIFISFVDILFKFSCVFRFF